MKTNKDLEGFKSAILTRIEMSGVIQPGDRDFLEGIHFCPEWDEGAIYKELPEWDCCTCKIKQDLNN